MFAIAKSGESKNFTCGYRGDPETEKKVRVRQFAGETQCRPAAFDAGTPAAAALSVMH
jgi:hypothetical protein